MEVEVLDSLDDRDEDADRAADSETEAVLLSDPEAVSESVAEGEMVFFVFVQLSEFEWVCEVELVRDIEEEPVLDAENDNDRVREAEREPETESLAVRVADGDTLTDWVDETVDVSLSDDVPLVRELLSD